MTRQAALPAQRWLFVLALLGATWLGQGVASAVTMTVDPQSGPSGTEVTVSVSDFVGGCAVYFDDVPVGGDVACEDASVTFTAEGDVGNHQIYAIGRSSESEIAQPMLTFRITASSGTTAPPTTGAATATTVAGGEDEVPARSATTVARNVTTTTAPSGSPSTTTPVLTTSAGNLVVPVADVFAAGCPPRQVALLRFSLQPLRGKPGTPVAAATTWGSVGACTKVGSLLVLFDGKPIPASPPQAGRSGTFGLTVPKDAKAGPHTISLVAVDGQAELATLSFAVAAADPSPLPLIAAGVAAAIVLLLLILLWRRRRRRRRERADAEGRDGGPIEPLPALDDGWAGVLDVPDIATPPAGTPMVVLPGAPPPPVAVEDDPTMPVVPLVVASGRDGSFYLLERQNPHAPRRPNGKRGWYRTERMSPIRGIVVRRVDPHTAGAAASELASGEAPASAHAVVDADGVLELMPDDLAPMYRPDIDDAVLVVLLAGFGADPTADEMILGHAAAWATTKMQAHAIPARIVAPDEVGAGTSGLVTDDAGVPWHRIVPLAATAAVGFGPPAESPSGSPTSGPPTEPSGPPTSGSPPEASMPVAAALARPPAKPPVPEAPAADQFATESMVGREMAPPSSQPPAPTMPPAPPPVPRPPVLGARWGAPTPAVPPDSGSPQTDMPASSGPASPTPAAPIPGAPTPEAPIAEAPIPGAPIAEAPFAEAPSPGPPISGPISGPPSEAPTPQAPIPGAPIAEAPIPGAPLPGATFGEAPIPGAPISGAPIIGAPISGSPISGAPFADAPPPYAPTPGAPMPGAPLSGAPVPQASAPGSPLGRPTSREIPAPDGDGEMTAAGRPADAAPTAGSAEAEARARASAVATGLTPSTPPPAADATAELPVPGPPPVPTAQPPIAAPAPRPRGRRTLPTPDELITRVTGATTYYLLDHENPHATLRADGRHGWYYPTRYGGVRAVVLHTVGGGSAEEAAAHLAAVDQPEAAHAVVDPESIIDLLPDEATALHGLRSSSAALDLALAYEPSRWGTDPAAEEGILVRAAAWSGVRAVRHGIAIRRITVEEWHAGQGGMVGNGDVDPGPDFPWDRFLQLTAWVAGRVASGAMSSR